MEIETFELERLQSIWENRVDGSPDRWVLSPSGCWCGAWEEIRARLSPSNTCQQITPEKYEEILNWMYDAEMEGGIELKAT